MRRSAVRKNTGIGGVASVDSRRALNCAGFNGPFILAGGFDQAGAEKALAEKRADLIAFGRPLLANPDLVQRFHAGAILNAPDMASFYTADVKGSTDYPALAG